MTAEATSESIQPSPAVQSSTAVAEQLSPARADLPPPDEPHEPDTRWGDRLFILGVLLLAAFVASFPAQNSNLWMHLAMGRQIAGGAWPGAADSFSYTAETAVNPSWLFDTLCYLCWRLGGGAALVGLRVLLVVGLGLLVLFAAGLPAAGRRPAPVLCAALLFLTVARWLPLQPELASVFLLGATLALLLKRERSRCCCAVDFVPFFVLFALWANLDSWFVLGPVLLALYCVGTALKAQPNGPRPGLLILAAVGGFAACLVNPWLWRVFDLPVQLLLSPAAAVMTQDPIGRNLRISLLQKSFYRDLIDLGPSAVGFALLALVGLASFLRSPRTLLSWRFVAWVGLLALGLYQMRVVGFFAVASALLACANRRDFSAREESAVAWGAYARPLLGLSLLLLVVAAWPGWLQGRPYGARRWVAQPSESARRLAKWLAAGHADGSIGPEARCFNFTPELANHLAWASPEDPSFLDARLNLFSRQTAQEYRTVRQALLDRAEGKPAGQEWRKILRQHKVRYLLLTDPDRQRRRAVFTALMAARHEWALLAVAGDVAVFGWKDGEPTRFRECVAALERAGLFPDADHTAPEEGPTRDARAKKWFEPFRRSVVMESADREEALYYFLAFAPLAAQQEADRIADWEAAESAAAVTGATIGPMAGPALMTLHLQMVRASRTVHGKQVPAAGDNLALIARRFVVYQDRPAALPLLLSSIRAARRAVARDPDDALAWLFLGEGYLAMQSQEAMYRDSFPLLRELRRAQVSSAFHQAVRRQPDLALAHLRLVEYYQFVKFNDLELKHLRAYRRTIRDQGGTQSGLSANALQDLEDKVRARTKQYEREKGRAKILDRAQLAFKLGLAGKALELLLNSDYSAFGTDGATLELDLLLATGEARDVDEMVDPDKSKAFGPKQYHWLRAQVALAVGDYAKADADLAEMTDLVVEPPTTSREYLFSLLAARVTTAVALRLPNEGGPAGLALPAMPQSIILRNMLPYAAELERDTDRMVLRGLVAVEKGDAATAERWLRLAVDTYGSRAKAVSGAGLDFAARPAAQSWLTALRAAK